MASSPEKVGRAKGVDDDLLAVRGGVDRLGAAREDHKEADAALALGDDPVACSIGALRRRRGQSLELALAEPLKERDLGQDLREVLSG